MRLWIQFKNGRKTARPLMLRQTEAKKFRKISRFRLFSAFRGFGTCQPPFAYLKMSILPTGLWPLSGNGKRPDGRCAFKQVSGLRTLEFTHGFGRLRKNRP
jgi:hypothetical protein